MKTAGLKVWFLLFGLQALVALAIFPDFLWGKLYFAYVDIGSDSYAQVVPFLMHMAREIARGEFSGWSFQIGLGSPMALYGNLFDLLAGIGGPGGVLGLRIWVYLLKIILGGASFFLLARSYTSRWETAVICALAYSFCGFIVVNGQWDPEATEFVFFPLILWAISSHLKSGNTLALPVVLAATLMSGVFFVAVGAFIFFSAIGFIVTSREPGAMFRTWLTRVLPLTMIGYLLAAPVLLPAMFQMLDSSRVGGGESLFQKIWTHSFVVHDWQIILAEIGGLFHKDIFGIGSHYRGYWNYLEGPEFFIGVMLFLVIPQLWNRSGTDRKILLIALGAVVAYFMFPIFRYAAMGFAAPYFRVSTLWVSLVLLMLSARAVDHVIENGVNSRLLLVGFGIYTLLLALLLGSSVGDRVWIPHVIKILGLTVLAVAVLSLANRKTISTRLLPFALLGVVLIESIVIARPSFVYGRSIVSSEFRAYDDGTLEALRHIREIDKGVFRVEKTYDSVSLADSMAQDYMGVKSYSFHSRGVVDFNIGLGLIPAAAAGGAVNYTNWLPNAGARFMLNSLLGVKYIISREPLQWPGFLAMRNERDYQIYRNEMALPLGIVQTRQITQRTFSSFSAYPETAAAIYQDIAIINAVVVENLVSGYGDQLGLGDLSHLKEASLQDAYFAAVRELQATGLHIEQFSNTRVLGRINPKRSGILVFSIPFNQGWSLKIDGNDTPTMRANFGMLAAPVQAGPKTVELTFRPPGQSAGFLAGGLGFALLGFAAVLMRHRRILL